LLTAEKRDTDMMNYATRENRKLAIKWARQKVRPNSPYIVSDQFWAPYVNSDEKTVRNTVRKLNDAGILVFQGPGKTGAVLVHKKNPKLTVETVNVLSDKVSLNDKKMLMGVYTNTVDGENFVSTLTPWQLTFAA